MKAVVLACACLSLLLSAEAILHSKSWQVHDAFQRVVHEAREVVLGEDILLLLHLRRMLLSPVYVAG